MEADDGQVKGIRQAFSPERFGPYDAACGGDKVAAVRLYAWNAEAAGAFWGPLHCMEIVLRNAMHREMTIVFGRPDWWNAPRLLLHPAGARMLAEALARCVPAVPVHDLVAELSFGFWVSLLGRGENYEMRLWRPGLYRAFPGYTGPRGQLSDRLNSVRLLRNKIAHHEPIFHRHLAADHAKIIRLISYVSPDTADFASRLDRVPAVLARRDAVCAGRAPASF